MWYYKAVILSKSTSVFINKFISYPLHSEVKSNTIQSPSDKTQTLEESMSPLITSVPYHSPNWKITLYLKISNHLRSIKISSLNITHATSTNVVTSITLYQPSHFMHQCHKVPNIPRSSDSELKGLKRCDNTSAVTLSS